MCVELGILRKQIKDSKGKEKLVTEYLDSQLNDSALEAVLKIGYEQFKVTTLLHLNWPHLIYLALCIAVKWHILFDIIRRKQRNKSPAHKNAHARY